MDALKTFAIAGNAKNAFCIISYIPNKIIYPTSTSKLLFIAVGTFLKTIM